MARVAFLGLGVMGYPMAGHLAAHGHEVAVFNRSRARAETWAAQHPGRVADTPRDAAEGAEFVMACVGNDDDLRAVVLDEHGALAGMASGAVFVDHTTVSAAVTRELAAQAAEIGVAWIDAPVSGGQVGAQKGMLSVMCGGCEADYARTAPIIDSYAKICRLMGPVGAGQITKMCNQIAIAGLVQGLAESLAFARASDLSLESVVEVISQGAAGSWQMNNRWKTMEAGDYDHGFAVDWMRKDLAICLNAADQVGVSLPVTALVDQFYAEVQRMGGGRWDTSSLMARLERDGTAGGASPPGPPEDI